MIELSTLFLIRLFIILFQFNASNAADAPNATNTPYLSFLALRIPFTTSFIASIVETPLRNPNCLFEKNYLNSNDLLFS